MAWFRVLHYALIGALVGLASSVRSRLFYSLYFPGSHPYGYSDAEAVWVMIRVALQDIALCAFLGVVVGISMSRRSMGPLRVPHCALIGALLGLLPPLRSAVRYFRYFPHDSSPVVTAAQLAWHMLKMGLPEIVLSAVVGAVVGILVSRRRRSKDLAGTHGAQSDGLSGTNETWVAERQTFLLIPGTLITAVLLWYTPHLMLYPSLGVALAWVITRRAGWTSAGGVLFLGGLVGDVVHFWSGKLYLLAAMGMYATDSAELGLTIAILFITFQALGPTLLLMGLTPSLPSKPVPG
jgi:hypothetical protein